MKDGRPIALVTGANGFVGRHVTATLERNGWIVRRAVRSWQGAGDHAVVLPIGPTTQWEAALLDVEAVIHLAARVHQKKDERAGDLYRETNVEGTLHLARSAAKCGVGQFIFISTVLVHGRSNDHGTPFSEKDGVTPQGLYGRSKAAAEAGLQSLAHTGEMKITVIRPPLIYGAAAKGNFALLETAVRRGIPLPFAAIRNRRAFLSVENFSAFVLHLLANADRNFDVFLLADGEQVSTPEFIDRLARAAGVPSRLYRMPVPLLRTLLNVSGRSDMGEGLLGSLELDLSKSAATGWRPAVTLDEGLRLAVHKTVV